LGRVIRQLELANGIRGAPLGPAAAQPTPEQQLAEQDVAGASPPKSSTYSDHTTATGRSTTAPVAAATCGRYRVARTVV